VLLLGSDAFEFSWRYQLPAVVLLPLAGVLGAMVLAARFTRRGQPQTVPLRGTFRLIR
jgi:hypothetical protein